MIRILHSTCSLLILSLAFSPLAFAQNEVLSASLEVWSSDWSDVRRLTTASTTGPLHEIKHDIIDGYGWFGGDDRPNQGPRHVGAGQSVLVDEAMTVERFSFYFRGPFDYAANPDGTSHSVTLALNVRDASGAVLKTLHTDVPDTFTEGWVPWDGIDLEVPANTVLIFTTYLVGGYDVLQVNASQGADVNASYTGGERFGKHGISDADMEAWTDWSVHPSWDSAFKLEGTLATPTQTHIGEGAEAVPEGFVLHQNYPNPFNPATTISFHLAEPGDVDLTIFNMMGQAVRTLAGGPRATGAYTVAWDGRNGSGQPVASGTYVYRLQVGEAVQTRRMLFVK